MAAPGAVAGGWVGGVADKREGQALAIGLGARDVALALGALRALGAGHGAGGWLRARDARRRGGPRRDAARPRRLPPLAVPAVAALAGGSVVLGAWLQAVVD